MMRKINFNFSKFDYKNLIYIAVFIVIMYALYLYFKGRNNNKERNTKLIDKNLTNLTQSKEYLDAYASTLDSKFGDYYNSSVPTNYEVFSTLLSFSDDDLIYISNELYDVYGKSLARSVYSATTHFFIATESAALQDRLVERFKKIGLPF